MLLPSGWLPARMCQCKRVAGHTSPLLDWSRITNGLKTQMFRAWRSSLRSSCTSIKYRTEFTVFFQEATATLQRRAAPTAQATLNFPVSLGQDSMGAMKAGRTPQVYPASIVQPAEQPSPPTTFRSSHSSRPCRIPAHVKKYRNAYHCYRLA